ncbi:glycosyltransferase family 4 protein [Patescibacteria group bacterium]|nr:glycosyltransferase family 4 protein [Patescibacteria group bacterium]
MRICCFARITWQHDIKGGMEIHTKVLAEGLVECGHQITVITGRHPNGLTQENINGVNYYYLPNTPYLRYSRSFYQKANRKFLDLHEHTPFNLVWSESSGGYGYITRLRRKTGIPVVITTQGTWFGELRTKLTVTTSLLQSLKQFPLTLYKIPINIYKALRSAPYTDAVIVAADYLVNDTHRYNLVPLKKIHIVYNGVDQKKFCYQPTLRTETRSNLHIEPNTIVFLSIGRIEKEKGYHLLPKVFQQLISQGHKIHWLLAGQGQYLSAIKKLVTNEAITDSADFLGFVRNENTPALYNAADIFILPTLRIEGLPLTFCEAMLCGLPIVTTNLGGNSSAVEHEKTGYLTQKGDQQQLLEYSLKLAADQELRNTMAKEAIKKAETNFTQRLMVEKTLKVFEYVI